MAALAKGLPVFLIPEQRPIATMRNDVIDYGRRSQHTVPAAFRAERVLPQVQHSGFSPTGVVPTGKRTAT